MNWRIVFLSAAAAGLMGSAAQAAEVGQPPNESGWTFVAAPYAWASGIEGTAGIFGLPPQHIDLSFSDVLENLDMAFMGLGEARRGPVSIGMDIVYAKLGTTVDTPFGIAADHIDVTAKTFMGTAYAGYSLFDNGSARFDAIAGARVWSVNTNFDFDGGFLGGRSADDGDTWVDPLIGAKFRTNLGASDFYFSGWGMIGGFGVSSDVMWDVMGGIGYDFNESFSLFGGYRATGVDYSKDGFVYDVTQQGPVLGGVFRF